MVSKKKQAGHKKKPKAKTRKARRKVPARLKLLLVAFGFLVILLLEAVLRIVGFGAQTRLFEQRTSADGIPVYRLNPHASERFFFRRFEGRPVAPSRVLPVEFPAEKPPGTIRIFALGGSTTAGFPYPRSAAFAGFLRAMLSDLHPEKRFEVINCGLTALNSFAVLDFMPEILRCDPDLVVIYCAHNEFYGAHGVGSLERVAANRAVIRLFMAMQKVRLYQAVKRLVGLFRKPHDAKSATTLIQVMARDQEIRRYGRKHEIAERNFRKNLEAILNRARRKRVPVVLTTVVSNVRDLSPLRSAHRENLSEGDLGRWKRLSARAAEAEKQNDLEQAEALLRQALAIDAEYAKTYYRLARLQAQAGRWAEARPNFERALEFDVLHFRADGVFNDIIRKVVAEAPGDKAPAILADIVAPFDNESEGGVVGDELMTDHLHPNTRGNFLIARSLCEALSKSPIAQRFGRTWDFARLRKLDEYETEVGYSPIERALVARVLLNLYEGFPFETQLDRKGQLARLREETERAELALSPEERSHLDDWSGSRHTFALHLQLGSKFLEQKDYTKAADAFHEAVRQIGQGTPEDYQRAWLGLASASRGLGRFGEALDAYRKALEYPDHHAEIWYGIGRVRLATREHTEAQQALEKALELEPAHTDALISLGILLRDRRQNDRARSYFERATNTPNGHVIGHYHLARLELAQGRSDAAIAQLRKALAADANHVQSLRLLGFCHLGRNEFAEAETVFSQALALDATDAATWFNRACAAMGRSRPDEAIRYLEQAIAHGGESMRRRAAAEPGLAPLQAHERFKALIGAPSSRGPTPPYSPPPSAPSPVRESP